MGDYFPAAGGGGGGVTQITAGSNVTISPAGGTGDVTINATAGLPPSPQYLIQAGNVVIAHGANTQILNISPSGGFKTGRLVYQFTVIDTAAGGSVFAYDFGGFGGPIIDNQSVSDQPFGWFSTEGGGKTQTFTIETFAQVIVSNLLMQITPITYAAATATILGYYSGGTTNPQTLVRFYPY